MCIILFGWRAHPRYPLVVAANRDEFYDRPTAAAAFWSDNPAILAGRDLRCGGTWLGITRDGRFAAVTNYREAKTGCEAPRSRGHLVSAYLGATTRPAAYLRWVHEHSREYGGFNLLVGDGESMLYLSNRDGEIRTVAAGVHGLSNALLDTPWPKVKRGKAALQRVLARGEPRIDAMLELLNDELRAPDQALPRTGIELEWERALSSILIRTPSYGTRSSTALTVDVERRVCFLERSYVAALEAATTGHTFTITPSVGDH